jgi:hypothetical protein
MTSAWEDDMYASIARFCVGNRRWVLAAWMLLFVAGIAIGSMVFSRLHESNGAAGTESAQGYDIVRQASSMGPSAVVLVKGPPVAAASTYALGHADRPITASAVTCVMPRSGCSTLGQIPARS